MRNFMMSLLAVLAALGIFQLPAATAATLTGKVTLQNGRPAKDAVVYLEGAGTSSPMRSAMVDQRERTFIPHVSIITVGTTVKFPNDDTVYHNVFAYFRAKKFDLGMYPRGVSKSVTFDKVGVVALQCNIHPDMSAYIMVVDTAYYTKSNPDGTYAIKDVPPGSYTLHAWHESGEHADAAINQSSSNQSLNFAMVR